jgi:hypothetical protein
VPLLGILGAGILRDYEVVIDYPHLLVTCYSLQTKTSVARPFVRQDSLAFTLVQGRPITTGYIGQVPMRLLLDTGSVRDNLDTEFCQTLAPANRPVLQGTDYTTGASGQRQRTQLGTLPSLVLGEVSWQQMPVEMIRYARPTSGRALDFQGTLGHLYLLKLQTFSFHYGHQQLYILTPSTSQQVPTGK